MDSHVLVRGDFFYGPCTGSPGSKGGVFYEEKSAGIIRISVGNRAVGSGRGDERVRSWRGRFLRNNDRDHSGGCHMGGRRCRGL